MIESISCEALLTCEIMPFRLTTTRRTRKVGPDVQLHRTVFLADVWGLLTGLLKTQIVQPESFVRSRAQLPHAGQD